MIQKTIPFYLLFTMLTTSSLAYANTDMTELTDALKTHTSTIKVSDSDYAYGHIMRKAFQLVRFRQLSGLSESDLLIFDKAKSTATRRADNARYAMEPYMNDIADGIENDDHPVILASIWEQAIAAQRIAIGQYYEDIVDQLSIQGQSVLNEFYDNELQTMEIHKTDYISVAQDAPEQTLEHFRTYLQTFRNQIIDSRSRTEDSSSIVYKRIQILTNEEVDNEN
jgi:hypothetical protein